MTLELKVGPSEYCWSQRGPELTLDITLQSLCHMSWGKEEAVCVCVCVCVLFVCKGANTGKISAAMSWGKEEAVCVCVCVCV